MTRPARVLSAMVLVATVFMATVSAATVLAAGCSSFSRPDLKIETRPRAADFHRGTLTELPIYDPAKAAEGWQVDLRGYDLSALDLKDRLSDLLHANFDSATRWPASLPGGFDPDSIMRTGKDPGLGIRSLHAEGITGKGVGLAIIDQALLVDHVEYAQRLRLYEEIHSPSATALMHGLAVASIAVGKTVGVAPEANLYYIAEEHWTSTASGTEYDLTSLAQSIDRILEVNRSLPAEKKIRVISISAGWKPGLKGYSEVTKAVNRAKKVGIFVVSSSLWTTYGLFFNGLGREPMADPNSAASYGPGSWWAQRLYSGQLAEFLASYCFTGFSEDQALLVPMDARTTASPTGPNDYVFYSEGGWSWSIPYIAGLYALACQVKPSINPLDFWKAALETATPLEVTKDSQTFRVGRLVNPPRLIEALQSGR